LIQSLIFLAAKYGSFEICELLIHTIKHLLFQMNRNCFRQQYLSLIWKKNLNQRTPIHEAARIGNLDFVIRIINNEHRIAFWEDSDDELKTSLHLAASEGKNQLSESDSKQFFSRSFRNR
jgi:ankyrin repeat protein